MKLNISIFTPNLFYVLENLSLFKEKLQNDYYPNSISYIIIIFYVHLWGTVSTHVQVSILKIVVRTSVHKYKARHAHKRLYTVLPKYSKIQVLPGITSCRLVKDNKQAIELNSLLLNNMPKDGCG